MPLERCTQNDGLGDVAFGFMFSRTRNFQTNVGKLIRTLKFLSQISTTPKERKCVILEERAVFSLITSHFVRIILFSFSCGPLKSSQTLAPGHRVFEPRYYRELLEGFPEELSKLNPKGLVRSQNGGRSRGRGLFQEGEIIVERLRD